MTLRKISLAVAAILAAGTLPAGAATQPVPSDKPSSAQLEQIGRKYGMFCHFGINTYVDQEWTDGSLPAETYAPPANLEEGIDDWIRTARDSGMRYFLCITKHHDGFCLWDSKLTDYDVGNPKVKNHLDVVGAVAKACKKYGIAFAVYYSLWDRHDPSYADPAKYRDFMLGQLRELMTNYGPVCELWLDGSWVRPAKDWYLPELYTTVKALQPNCQIAVNWSIGTPENPDQHNITPDKQKTGYPIRYFPSDFRLSDPYLPVKNDPKLFTHGGKTYYMPYETTVTVSGASHWFYNTKDNTAKSVDSLESVFRKATTQDNCLVFNVPPDRNGNLVPAQKKAILDLAQRLDIGPGKPFPAARIELSDSAKASATSVWPEPGYGPEKASDGDAGSRWASKENDATFSLNWTAPVTFSKVRVSEYTPDGVSYRVTAWRLEARTGGSWKKISSGKTLGAAAILSFAPVTADALRLVMQADAPVSLWEVGVSNN